MQEWNVPGYIEMKALGSGGSGDVVLARHDASGALVAIKYMRRHLRSDPQFAEMFRGEAEMLASLDDLNTSDTGTQIMVTSPPGTGTVDITVTTRSGTSVATRVDLFTYVSPIQ